MTRFMRVVGVLLQLLGEVLDAVFAFAHVFGDGLADVEQQQARAAGGVVDLDGLSVFQVVRDDLRHQHRDLMRGVELSRLLSCIGGKHANEVLVDEAEHVVALLAIHGDVFDQLQGSLIALVCFAAVSPSLLRPVSAS